MTRHCTRCDAEVEDTGGYCLLGHPLRLNMETTSLADLKAEVEAAFESAQDEVRDTLSPLLEQVEATPPKTYETTSQPLMAAVAVAPSLEVGAPAAVEQPTRPTPPPPPPKRPKSKFEALWEGMEGGKPLDRQDPINAFAPPPRMDWGPERTPRKGRSLRRLRPTSA
jgi:hypothetical protein